ncbi:Uncharacterised protein [Yersinia intermedia]|nr:Uncharacterised protein [Yersinia intermedia]
MSVRLAKYRGADAQLKTQKADGEPPAAAGYPKYSCCRQAASERIPGSIDNYVTRVSERRQRTCGAKNDG